MIIPRPVKAHAHPDRGRVTLTADGFVIAADEASRPVASLLRAALEASTGWDIAVVPVSSEARSNAVTLIVGPPDGGGLPADGYLLRAAPGEGVVINAGAPAGVFYAAQTLRLLLPPETLRKAPEPIKSGHSPPVRRTLVPERTGHGSWWGRVRVTPLPVTHVRPACSAQPANRC